MCFFRFTIGRMREFNTKTSQTHPYTHYQKADVRVGGFDFGPGQFQTSILSSATLKALDLTRADSPNQTELRR